MSENSIPTVSATYAREYNTGSQNFQKKESTFDDKNYLNLSIPEGKNSTSVTIRILPDPNNEGYFPFTKVHLHTLKIKDKDKAGGFKFKSFICNKYTTGYVREGVDNRCPFCETLNSAFKKRAEFEEKAKNATSDAERNEYNKEAEYYKGICKENGRREAMNVRCIQRGKEDEGVKWLRIKLSKDKDDLYHQIMGIFEERINEVVPEGHSPVNIFDSFAGKDLTIKISKKSGEQKGNATQVIESSYVSPISEDTNKMKEWIYDSKKWYDVFGVKPYEYMDLMIKGLEPWYDRSTGKWVDKEVYNAERSAKKNEETERKTNEIDAINREYQKDLYTTATTQSTVMKSCMVNDKDELPF